MKTPLWILSDPEEELAAGAITARLEAAGIQIFHVREDESETGAAEIHVLTNDYEEAWEIVESVLSSGTKKYTDTAGPPWELVIPLVVAGVFVVGAFSRLGIVSYISAAAAVVSLVAFEVLRERRLERRKKMLKQYE